MLTQLFTVKQRLGIDPADITDDALLTNAIKGISARAENECNRFFARADAATFQFNAYDMDIRVDCWPVEQVAGFEYKSTEAEGWQPVSPDPDCLINEARNVIQLSAPIGSSAQVARVTFAGGYVLPGATPDDGQAALPDDLEQAVIEQVAYWYQRRTQLGLVSISGDGGSIQQFRSLDLLPGVQAVLKSYERWVL